jgi:hypothetical protein
MDPPPGLIPLRDAADMVGRALYGTSWCPLSEAFPSERRLQGIFEIEVSATEVATEVILLKLNPEVERVLTTIAKWVVNGELSCVYFSARGKESLDCGEWQWQGWRSYFIEGTINLVVPLLDEKGNPIAGTTRGTFEIFVVGEDLERLIATLSKPVTEQPKPVVKPTKQQQGQRRGRKPRYDWPAYKDSALQLLNERGDPEEENQVKGWSNLTEMAETIQASMKPKPDLSTVRKYAVEWLAEWRKNCAQASNNSA